MKAKKKNKQKTKKSLVNRFKISKSGKILRRQAFRRHLKASKSKKRLRNLKKSKLVTGFYAKKIRKSLGVKVKKTAKEKKHGKS